VSETPIGPGEGRSANHERVWDLLVLGAAISSRV